MKRSLVLLTCALAWQSSAAQAEATLSGGKGTSIQDAVIVNATGEYEGVKAEYGWLKQNNPGCKKDTQSLTTEGDRSYDMVVIACGAEKRTFYFDVTSFVGKL